MPTRCIMEAAWLPRGVFNCAEALNEMDNNRPVIAEIITVFIFIKY